MPHHSRWIFTLLLDVLVLASRASGSTLKISESATARRPDEVEADYGCYHVDVNELAPANHPVTFFFDPQTLNVESAEIFTNLNRRAWVNRDANGDGIPDGIEPPDGNAIAAGDDFNYYKAYPMQLVQGGYILTLPVQNCGVYRVTARYRLIGDPPGSYRWYGSEKNAAGILKRDFVIVASPPAAYSLSLYEINPLTILATSSAPQDRGTLEALAQGLPAGSVPAFSLDYVKKLGCNAIWLMPIHPRGLEDRQTDPATQKPYELGSPYSVRNFFAVMPLLSKTFVPGNTPADNDTAAGRAAALTAFRDFVHVADAVNVSVLLDAPFNHAAADVELADDGVRLWNACTGRPTAAIRDVEARVFSQANEYDERAFNAQSLGLAPDRNDFGKWSDVRDLYFGRYAALVANTSDNGQYLNEEDYLDYSIGSERQTGIGNGHFDQITQNVWRYFADYLQFWLTATGYPDNASGRALATHVGIDGLRADFAQGLPPQCWEYIINRTRTRRWDFVFMAETLDGGAVAYRSNRHFDILNENTIYDLHHAQKSADYENIYNARTALLGHGLTLLNTSSQDEDNYKDPYEAVTRHATNATSAGALMIFPGQELGLKGTIVPPGNSDPNGGPLFGYDRFESAFFGKPIPQFKTYNSMMPLWTNYKANQGGSHALHDVFAAIGRARLASPALRGQTRVFLSLKDGTRIDGIYATAKMEKRNGDPKTSDVVLAFVNLTPHQGVSTANHPNYNLAIDQDGDGANDLGIRPDRLYNIKNLAAYEGSDQHRADQFIWPNSVSGADLLTKGIFVQLNPVPANDAGWIGTPYEPQYLKLYDVTP